MLETVQCVVSEERVVSEGVAMGTDGEGVERGGEGGK